MKYKPLKQDTDHYEELSCRKNECCNESFSPLCKEFFFCYLRIVVKFEDCRQIRGLSWRLETVVVICLSVGMKSEYLFVECQISCDDPQSDAFFDVD